MLECVVNISEGRRSDLIDELRVAAPSTLLDVHQDADHHRSVFTLAGNDLIDDVLALATRAVQLLDLRTHSGAHPRLGIVDVVPFAPIDTANAQSAPLEDALIARNVFAKLAAEKLSLPCFFYGPERQLPEIRARAFQDLWPDVGPRDPDPRIGACCVGARLPLVAYNVWVNTDLASARRIAHSLRTDNLRVLAFELDGHVQISCNLVAPWQLGPNEVFDLVAKSCAIERAELVGLLPASVLAQIPRWRWQELDLDDERTIEARLSELRS